MTTLAGHGAASTGPRAAQWLRAIVLGPRGGGTPRRRAPDAFRLGSAGVITCLVVFGLLVPRLAAVRWIALAAVVTWALCALLGEILGPGAGRPVAGASTGVDTIAIGWAVAAALHLVAGSPLGLPSAEDVTRGIADLRVTVQGVMRAPHQVWGVEKFSGQDAEGNVIELPVYGRDATGARAVAKLRRFCFYRDSGFTSAGVPEDAAVAAVFFQRLFTACLPPIWGWVTLAWMRRRQYV